MKHRILSIITALALCLSLCPTWALAAEGHSEQAEGDEASVTVGGTTTYYSTIEDAWAAAQGQTAATVTLLGNVALDDRLYIAEGDNITFEGGDYTLTGPGTVFEYLSSSDGTLTFASGTVISTGAFLYGVRVSANCTGTFIMTGGTIQAPRGIYLESKSSEASVKINGGTIISSDYDYAVETHNGATIGSLLDQGGTSRVAFYKDGTLVTNGLDQSFLPGGTYTVKPCTHEGALATDNGDGTHTETCLACGGESTVNHAWDEDGSCACGATAVASVTKANGDVIYVGKLADAFDTTDKSRSGATVKLLADVTTESSIILKKLEDFTLTLDLNGHTVTGSNGVITLNNLGFKLTIRGSGSITTSAGNAIDIGSGRGNLTLEGGTFSSDAQDGHGVYAADGNLIVTGEDVTVDRLGATNASVFLTAGTYTGNPAIAVAGKTPVNLLGNRANAYYKGGKPIARADLADPLAGPVTVKACQHPGAELTCNNNGTHYLTCICCPVAATSAPEPCTYVFPETGGNRNTGSCVCGSEVIVTVTGTEGLVYDGLAKAPSVTVTRDGKTLTDTVDYRVDYANNRNAGSDASVTVTLGGESGKGSGTYTQTFSIARADLEASVESLFGEGFALGTYGAKFSELPIYGLTAKLKGTDIPVSGTWELEGDAIPSVSDNGKEVTATFVPSGGAGNCNPLTAPVRLNIHKAAPLAPKTGDLAVTNEQAHTYTYGLGALRPEVPEGLSLGSSAVTYTLEAVNLGSYYSGSGAKIEGQTLTLPIEAVESEEVKEIGTITVAIHTGNYEDMTATIHVRSVNKTIPAGAPALSATTLTYGQAISAITLSGSMKDGDKTVPGTFTWGSPDNRPAVQEKYAAAWTFTPDDNGKYAIVNGTSTIRVIPAPIAGAVVTLQPASFRYDGQPHSPGITSVRLGDTTLAADTDYTAAIPSGTAAGTYTITVTGTGNYTGTVTAAFTIHPVETVEIDQKDDNGHDLRLEVQTGLSTVPAVLENDTRYDTPEKIETALRTRVELFMTNVGENIAVFDVTLQYKDESGTWRDVHRDDFPENGVTAILPYPAGTGMTGYTFTVQHLISSGDRAGEMEDLPYELTTDGLKCKFNSLSPVAIGYEAETKPVDPVDPSPVPPSHPTGGGGGGVSAYTVTVEKTEHGKVTSSCTNTGSGSTVTLTVAPEDGYVLDTLTVTDSRGSEIRLTAQGGGKYTFTMPGRAVTVKATFAPLPDDTEKPCDGGEDCPSRGFTDLGSVGTWYHDAVDYVLRDGLMSGYSNGTFGPNDHLSRAQLAQILFNREGRPVVNYLMQYGDVATGVWYTEAVRWATSQGIVGGYGNGMFGPDDSITREQLAVMLWRYAGSPAATDRELHFTDADKASSYALEALYWAVENGIISGSGGILDPRGLATRVQTAQMLKNFFDK